MMRLAILLFVAPTIAWTPQRISPPNRQHARRLKILLHTGKEDASNEEAGPTGGSSEPVTEKVVRTLELTATEDKALRAVSSELRKESAYGESWFENPDAWSQARNDYPELASYSDEELRLSYVQQPAKLLDIILLTPLGPVVLINLILYFTHFSWCDTPFGDAAACSASF